MDPSKRVVLGMSGGVDSSVSVAMLQQHGFEVVGVTFLFLKTEAAQLAAEDAGEVCKHFGIEHRICDCSEDFEACVISPFVNDYASGFTPSPCVGCNANMKIPSLIKVADDLGCAWVSTGHYARVNQMEDTQRFAILCALDHRKDQSYMLGMLDQNQLGRLVLPLGGMTKTEVRAIAAQMGLAVADKPDSQDICFAPEGYNELLRERNVLEQRGPIVNTRGEVVGRHNGLFHYTRGQRKGIGVAGAEPYYVIGWRMDKNELIVGTAQESLIGSVRVSKVNWQAIDRLNEPLEATVKLRYRSDAYPCIIERDGADGVRVRLRSLQPATAPGQYAVFYQGSVCIGAGMIEEVGS